MEQIFDDLLHAQPYTLCILAGLILVAIGVVGSIKTYIDPGKNGRIAAVSIGALLLIVGFILYGRTPAQPAAPASSAEASTPGQTTHTCKFTSGPDTGTTQSFPRAKPFKIGAPCYNTKGDHGLGIPDQP